jgi:hypothetical protein
MDKEPHPLPPLHWLAKPPKRVNRRREEGSEGGGMTLKRGLGERMEREMSSLLGPGPLS